jgi:alpha-1,2-mannosyltransferase
MALPMAFLFSPSIDSLYSGQITIILLLLLTLFTILYVKGKQIAAAFILALAISLKLIPAGFIIYFLVRRDYRALIATFFFCSYSYFP